MNSSPLIINPDIDLSAIGDVHGMIVKKEGIEYRVIVDPLLRGMVDEETGEARAGFWLAPQAPLFIGGDRSRG